MTAKVFLLDPVKTTAPAGSQVPSFLKLAAARVGWDVSRPAVFEPGMDGARWLSKLKAGLEEADIIVGLGDFLALAQSGTDLDRMLMIVRQKIDSGCPALFDGLSSLSSNAFSDVEQKILSLFDAYGIHLTSTKVASRIHEYAEHSSPLCCVFRKDDDSLLDSRLFSDVDNVCALGSRLIEYQPEVFPLIEASGLHRFVNKGDLRTVGNLGKRNAIAVSRFRNKQCLMAFSGSFFRDRTETFFGVLPGLEDNKSFAENVIDELNSRIRRAPNFALSAFEVFCELEARLGDLIKVVLTRAGTGDDFYPRLPLKIQEKLRSDSGILNYARATYLDLVVTFKELWPTFQPYFISEIGEFLPREAVTKQLFEINEIRKKYLAHPHKTKQLGLEITAAELSVLEGALTLMRLASIRAS